MNHQQYNLPPFSATFSPLSAPSRRSLMRPFIHPWAMDEQWWSHPPTTLACNNEDQFAEMGVMASSGGVNEYHRWSSQSVETVDPRWLTRSASMETEEEEIGEMGPDSEDEEGIESAREEMGMGYMRTGGKKRPGLKAFADGRNEMVLARHDHSKNELHLDGQHPTSSRHSSQSSNSRDEALQKTQRDRSPTVIDLTSSPPADDAAFLPSPPTSTVKSPFLSHTFPNSQSQSQYPSPQQIATARPDSATSNLSSVPSTFIQRTPPLPKIYDSVTVISTPSPLPAPAYTPNRDLNRFTQLRRRGRPPGRKSTAATDGVVCCRGRKPRDPTHRSTRMVPIEEKVGERGREVREWTEGELRRVGELRMLEKRFSWREIAVEMDREVVDVRTMWRKRVKHRARTVTPNDTEGEDDGGDEVWDEYKVWLLSE